MGISRRMIVMIMIAIGLMTISGCAKWKNQIAADGGIFTSHPGDYIVISQSGGQIMDVWKLESVMVQAVSGSDGWLFRDEDGVVVFIGGDVKSMRWKKGKGKDAEEWKKYHEYHMEFESMTYREKFNNGK